MYSYLWDIMSIIRCDMGVSVNDIENYSCSVDTMTEKKKKNARLTYDQIMVRDGWDEIPFHLSIDYNVIGERDSYSFSNTTSGPEPSQPLNDCSSPQNSTMGVCVCEIVKYQKTH